MSSSVAVRLTQWLLSDPSRAQPVARWFETVGERLHAAGVPVERAVCGLNTWHPEVQSETFTWLKGRPVVRTPWLHDVKESDALKKSPIAVLTSGDAAELHIRLDGPRVELEYPLCRELADEGYTDYFAIALYAYGGRHTAVTWATRAPEGFSDGDLQVLREIAPAMGIRIELDAAYRAQETLLQTYLGKNAARRVLDGAFERGHGEHIQAAIWLCDLRGFTERVDSTTVDDVVQTLDTYFGLVAEPVGRHGGEILKFVGDAVLGIFPFDDASPGEACGRALASARDALARAEVTNRVRSRSGQAVINFGIALHAGEVLYGNIGCSDRLDFTVIGAAVNEATRIEGLCRDLRTPLLLSSAFTQWLPEERMSSLGKHKLRGVKEPIELFTPPEYVA